MCSDGAVTALESRNRENRFRKGERERERETAICGDSRVPTAVDRHCNVREVSNLDKNSNERVVSPNYSYH